MLRLCWIVLLLLWLAGCGQPLQLNPTPIARSTRPPVQGPTVTAEATHPLPASDVPSGGAAQAPTQAALPATTTAITPTSGVTITAESSTEPASAGPTTDVVVVPQPPSPRNNEERWRAQQIDRQVLEQAQTYVAKNPVQLLWFDPLTAQSVEVGTLIGEFTVQARFTFRGTNSPALEVPYRINVDYGLTSISEAVRERMLAAGYAESVEAYVLQTDDVVPK